MVWEAGMVRWHEQCATVVSGVASVLRVAAIATEVVK